MKPKEKNLGNVSSHDDPSILRFLFYSVGLTPYRAAFLHLILVGIPFRFGFYLTNWGRNWIIPEAILPDPCSFFGSSTHMVNCTDTELFSLRDLGFRYFHYYYLAWFTWLVMRKTKQNLVSYHKILFICSTIYLLVMVWLQNYFHPTPTISEFESQFFMHIVIQHVISIGLSLWTVVTHPTVKSDSMKWSIPANAIFSGAVINLFVATAAFQAIFDHKGVKHYFVSRKSVTPPVKLCFMLGGVTTLLHAILLLRIRTFLNVPQLRSVCLFKFCLNVASPFIWLPELDKHVKNVDQRLTLAIRVSLTLIYLLGYLWAGKAEGFSRILSSEKDK